MLHTGPARLISDLHLRDGNSRACHRFFEFLDDTARAKFDALFILGDLFEYWVGDDAADEFQLDVASRIRSASESGLSVFFMAGNRDFLVGNTFASQCGMQCIVDPARAHIVGHDVVLMHGDTLCSDDADYQSFRTMVRQTAWQDAFLAQPQLDRQRMAATMREESRLAQESKALVLMDVNADAVASVFARHGVTTLIHGHTHRPAVHRVATSSGETTRWVLSDWTDTRADALEINTAGIQRLTLI